MAQQLEIPQEVPKIMTRHINRRTGPTLTTDLLRLAKYLDGRQRKVQAITIANELGIVKAWVATKFNLLVDAKLFKRLNRLYWQPSKQLGWQDYYAGMAGEPAPSSMLQTGRKVKGRIRAAAAARDAMLDTPAPDQAQDLLLTALKAERYDLLVKKYGAVVIANALGVTQL